MASSLPVQVVYASGPPPGPSSSHPHDHHHAPQVGAHQHVYMPPQQERRLPSIRDLDFQFHSHNQAQTPPSSIAPSPSAPVTVSSGPSSTPTLATQQLVTGTSAIARSRQAGTTHAPSSHQTQQAISEQNVLSHAQDPSLSAALTAVSVPAAAGVVGVGSGTRSGRPQASASSWGAPPQTPGPGPLSTTPHSTQSSSSVSAMGNISAEYHHQPPGSGAGSLMHQQHQPSLKRPRSDSLLTSSVAVSTSMPSANAVATGRSPHVSFSFLHIVPVCTILDLSFDANLDYVTYTHTNFLLFCTF